MVTRNQLNDHPIKYLIRFDNPVGSTGYELGLMETVRNIDDPLQPFDERIIHPFGPHSNALHVGILIKIDEAVCNGWLKVTE